MKQQSRKKVAKAKKKEDKKNAPPPAAATATAPTPSPLKKLQPPPPEWKPTMDSLRVLPCIQHLGLVVNNGSTSCSSSAAASKDNTNNSSNMIGKIPTAVLEHLLEERSVQSIVRKILADEKDVKKHTKNKNNDGHISSTYTFATSATIRELKERSEAETVATTRAISKHYRRASVQVRKKEAVELIVCLFVCFACVALLCHFVLFKRGY
jgi:hypothetical protein